MLAACMAAKIAGCTPATLSDPNSMGSLDSRSAVRAHEPSARMNRPRAWAALMGRARDKADRRMEPHAVLAVFIQLDRGRKRLWRRPPRLDMS
ncbi:hypothetical protein GCM10007301_42670 [Azorhizobium oxalatiphilum]|uniref:Uncharacterized protein n=2 Tax=Azorhizobium oxalatiphilum TaxID=980631 RepID=A0A917C9V6_9HYPH|nr:hypothetical protein GCM10007301_42670 [Azorhizobium oxalatiphilum]